MSQIIDALRQLKRQWTRRSLRPTGAERVSHRGTLDRILTVPAEGRSPRHIFGSTSDAFWFWCFTEGYRENERLRRLLPSLPADEVQCRFTGASGDDTMREAFSFYSLVKSLVSQHRAKPVESVLEFGCGWGRIIRWFLHDIEPDRLWGIDCMPEAIELCRSTNPYCRFELVNPFPPSNVPDDTFESHLLVFGILAPLGGCASGLARRIQARAQTGGTPHRDHQAS